VLSLQILLMFQFQTKQPQENWKEEYLNVGFYALAGVKLHLLFGRTYDANITALSNAAYYPEADNWAVTQLFAGLGEFAGKNADGKLGVGMLASFAIETGLKWRVGENLYLYSGLFFDCGLNDPTKNKREPVSNFVTVENLPNLSLLAFYKHSVLMNAKIKLRLSLYRPPKSLP